ncbi:MAG: hypothetical protein SFX18_06420 [Pirellulales bacterium]|nr:hypothetical protein [Pirellulales bacterium]
MTKAHIRRALLASLLAGTWGLSAVAVDVDWNGPAGDDWTVAGNWSTGALPGPGDNVFIFAFGGVTKNLVYTGAIPDTINELVLAREGDGTVTLDMTTGTLNVNSWLNAGQGFGPVPATGTGIINLSGNAILNSTHSSGGETVIGVGFSAFPGNRGELNIKDTAQYIQTANEFRLGGEAATILGDGILTISGKGVFSHLGGGQFRAANSVGVNGSKILMTDNARMTLDGFSKFGQTGKLDVTIQDDAIIELTPGQKSFIVAEDLSSEAIFNQAGNSAVNVGLPGANSLWFSIGGFGRATYNLNGGTITAHTDLGFNVGDNGGAIGVFNLANGTANVREVYVGKFGNGVGVINQTGGSLRNLGGGGEWRVGGASGPGDVTAYGMLNISGGTFDSRGNNLQIGAFGRGVLYQSGGLIQNDTFPAIARFTADSRGVAYHTGGTYTHSNAALFHIVAEEGIGQMTVDANATVELFGGLCIGIQPSAVGVVNLNGGVTLAERVFTLNPGSYSQLNFDGGTLRAINDRADFLEGLDAVTINDGGAVIDTNGRVITVNQPLLAPAGDGIKEIQLANNGFDYVGAPIVEITGGGGTGATAIAKMNGDAVDSIVITNPGQGYTSAPTVNLLGGGMPAPAVIGPIALQANSSGGLTKVGPGALLLSAASTYTGITRVSQGDLVLLPGASLQTPLVDVPGVGQFWLSGIAPALLSGTPIVTGTANSNLIVNGTNQIAGRVTGPGTVMQPNGESRGNTNIAAKSTLSVKGLRQNSVSLDVGSIPDPTRLQITPNGGGALGLMIVNNTLANLGSGLPGLNIGNDAILDLHDNDLIVYYEGNAADPNPLATITQYIDNYYNFGIATGSGVPVIGSTVVDLSGGSRVIIAVDNANSQFGDIGNPFYDQTLGNSTLGTGFNQIIVRFTYPGDYNLDGQVDGADYVVVDSNLGASTPGLSGGWTLGDGDFDGVVSAADYLPIDSNFGSGVGSPLAQPAVAAIPEPSVWFLAGIIGGGVALANWRRKHFSA